MVLDEVAVFIEPWEKWKVTTQDEFKAALQEITQRFHPQSVVSEQFENYLLLLKSPEPVPKDQLLRILSALKELTYVKQVSPVFYVDPQVPSSQLILTDKFIRTYAKPHPCPSPKERESFTPPHFGEGPGVGFVNLRKSCSCQVSESIYGRSDRCD